MTTSNDSDERKMTVETPLQIHAYDIDFMGIVNNTVYVKWLEDMRMAILDKYFPLADMLRDGNSPILAETCVKYLHPVTLESHLTGRCTIWMTGRSRWVAEHTIEGDGKTYATARQTGYYFNVERRRPVAFPDALLERFLEK